MGAWEELDTEISVELDIDDLDTINTMDDPYGIFEDVQEYCANLKTAIETGSSKGVNDLAIRNRSFQQQIISEVCDNPSGMLVSSIQEEEQNEYTYLIGTIINHIYPMSVEYGRGPVYPIHAKALAFYLDGVLVFRKSVGPAKPRPFVAPAYEKTYEIAEQIMVDYIGQEISNIN